MLFSYKSDAKLKEEIFDGTEIRNLSLDEKFPTTMTRIKIAASLSFKQVVEKFLGNQEARITKI